MIRKARFAACLVVLFLLQTTVAHRFSLRFVRVDLLFAFGAYVALTAEHRPALLAAIALGLARDFGSAGGLGASALVMVGATAAVVPLREGLVRESPWVDIGLMLLFVAACSAGDALLNGLVAGASAGWLLRLAAGQAAFTAAVTPLLSAALSALGVVAEGERLGA
ncbi:MAG: rod shape-determining protein MreD [Planctomycetota bacterium]